MALMFQYSEALRQYCWLQCNNLHTWS